MCIQKEIEKRLESYQRKRNKQTLRSKNLLHQQKNANKQIIVDSFYFFCYEDLIVQKVTSNGILSAVAKQKIIDNMAPSSNAVVNSYLVMLLFLKVP